MTRRSRVEQVVQVGPGPVMKLAMSSPEQKLGPVAAQHHGAHARRRRRSLLGRGDDALEHRGVERVVLVRAREPDLGDVIVDA